MIAYLTGTIIERSSNELILLVGGVGYRLNCSMNTLAMLPSNNETAELYTKLVVREDSMELYGFASKDEKNIFNMLTGVTGIGPKTAIAILGTMTLKDLKTAIAMNDTVSLSRAPGIGKKTAQRICLELRDKISDELLLSSDEDINNGFEVMPQSMRDAKSEALVALKTLGYTQIEASNAIKAVIKNHGAENLTADEFIRYALKSMGGM
ncbi:MAG: Holliday junction branch migration protein RuvA [Christensenellaceae bacterium]|nr:Holliday junction branch migration protein RuvA [Christensenellaceae bacterium]